jgi:hypothetical protein
MKKLLLTLTGVSMIMTALMAQADMEVCAGESYTLTSEKLATGEQPITYQWYENESPIGSSTPELIVTAGQAVAGEYKYVRVASNAACTLSSNTYTVQVVPPSTIPLSSGNASQLASQILPITIIYTAPDDATISLSEGGFPNGVTGTRNGSSFTISGTPTAIGTFGYALTASNGCAAAAGTITVVQLSLCTQCCYNGAAWVNCYVTTNPVSTYTQWIGNDNTTYFDGARSAKNGRANFTAITSSSVTIAENSAVGLCKSLGAGWYLPAYEELYAMSSTPTASTTSNNRVGAGILTSGTNRSSTEYELNDGHYSGKGTGTTYYTHTMNIWSTGAGQGEGKAAYKPVRCARIN